MGKFKMKTTELLMIGLIGVVALKAFQPKEEAAPSINIPAMDTSGFEAALLALQEQIAAQEPPIVNVTMPEIVMPEIVMPEVTVPEITMPEIDLSGFEQAQQQIREQISQIPTQIETQVQQQVQNVQEQFQQQIQDIQGQILQQATDIFWKGLENLLSPVTSALEFFTIGP